MEINQIPVPNRRDPRVNEFEIEYPALAEEFRKLQIQQYETFAKKMLSYGLSNIGVGNEDVNTPEKKYLSLAGCWYRMNDKIQRLKQLVLLKKDNPLEDEPVEDAYNDLSVYSIICLLVKSGFWRR